jgi:hypothetical protein
MNINYNWSQCDMQQNYIENNMNLKVEKRKNLHIESNTNTLKFFTEFNE